MALQFNDGSNAQGYSISETHEGIFHLKEALKAQGWSVPRSSDGTTYNSGGDQITHSGSGANGLNNSDAWFEIASPDGNHHFVFYLVFPGYSWHIAYAEDPFSGGTPGATQRGTSTSEQLIFGSGSAGSEAGNTLGISSSTGRVIQIAVDDSSPYGFWAYSYRTSDRGADFCVFLDPFIEDSYDASDPWPFTVGVVSTPTGTTVVGSQEAWSQYAGTWAQVALSGFEGWGGTGAIAPESGGTDPISGADITGPTIWGRRTSDSAPNGWRGMSSLFEVSFTDRSNGDTADRSATGAKDRIYLFEGAFSADWNGTDPFLS